MQSIAARYSIILRNQAMQKVAEFDSWSSLEYTKSINEVDSYSFTISGSDPRNELFELDGIVQIKRTVPGCNVPKYQEFVGLHRKYQLTEESGGLSKFMSCGVGLDDFLARTIINYKKATIKSEKSTV